MKTKALLLAAVLFAAGTSVTFAANDSNKDKNCSKDKTECTKGDKGDRKGKCGEGFNPFEGLNLTEAQQTKLNELRAQSCPMKKAEMKGEKKDGQKADKTQMREERQKGKREFLGKVKEILTHEQYVTFLENMAVNGHNRDNGRKAMMQKGQKQGKDGQKQGRDGKKSDRSQKQQSQDKK